MVLPREQMLLMSNLLNVSEYKPDYIERQAEPCPHCDGVAYERTNRYLFRCLNYECGRYW